MDDKILGKIYLKLTQELRAAKDTPEHNFYDYEEGRKDGTVHAYEEMVAWVESLMKK